MAIGTRITELRGKQSRRSFAKQIGIAENTLRNYEEKLSLPNSDVIAIICREFDVSAEWLVLGTGKRDKSLDSFPEEREDTKTISKLEAKIDALEEKLIDAQAEAIRAYKLVTENMQPASDRVQKEEEKSSATGSFPVEKPTAEREDEDAR